MVLNIVTLSIIQNAYALITTTRKKGENKNVGLISYAFVWKTESVIVLLVKNRRAFCLVSILPLNTRVTTVRFRQFRRFFWSKIVEKIENETRQFEESDRGSGVSWQRAIFANKNKKLDPWRPVSEYVADDESMTSERWTKVKAGSIDRWTCVDSGTSQRARSNRPLPVFFHLSRHSNVSTCHASSTSQEHLISFDPACPLLGTRDELPTLVNRVNETSWIGCIETRLNVVPWLTNHNTRVPREIQSQLTNIVQTSMLDYSRD